MHAHEELLGADFYEHELKHGGVGVSRAVSVLRHYYDDVDASIETRKGNKGERKCRHCQYHRCCESEKVSL